MEGWSGFGCVVFDDSIYFVGGYSWSMGVYKLFIICYCLEKGIWIEFEGDVVELLVGFVCVIVILFFCVLYNK